MAACGRSADDGDLPLKEAPMNILTRLFGPPPAVPARRVRRTAAVYELELEPEPEDEAPRGCGWSDSSHELQSGLWVQEHAAAAELAAELPLGPWLELHLAAWQPRSHA
jgi:hypothetical protein